MPDSITFTRKLTPAKLDRDKLITRGEFVAVLASDEPILHPLLGEPVSLSHADGAGELPESAPLYVEHSNVYAPGTSPPAGRITRLRQVDGETVGTVTLSTVHRGEAGLAADIAEGIITDLSVDAEAPFDDIDATDPKNLIATRWKLTGASLVGQGADPHAKVIRSATAMPGKTTPATDPKVVDHQTRVDELSALFSGLDGPEWVELHRDALASTDALDVVRSRVVTAIKAKATTLATQPTAQAGDDAADKALLGITRAMDWRTGLVPAEERKAAEADHLKSEFRGQTLLDMARSYLRAVNYDTAGMSRDQVAGKALVVTRAGIVSHSPGDFADLLAASVNKALAKGYDEAPETWQLWTGRDQAPDFNQATRPLLSAFSDLDEIPTDGEYNYGTFSDKAENFTLATYGKLFSISRKTLVNDDVLSAFSRIPRAMGRAASRKVGDVAYGILTANAAMNEDAVALFNNASHSNDAASGAAPSVATLNTAWAAMATQTEQGGHTVQIEPKYLLCPRALQPTCETLVAAAYNPATASGVDPMPRYVGRLQVVGDARLDANDTAQWYLAADGNMHDTVLVAFLDGIETPLIEEHDAPLNRDGLVYKVRHDFTAYAGDYRGLYRNAGN